MVPGRREIRRYFFTGLQHPVGHPENERFAFSKISRVGPGTHYVAQFDAVEILVVHQAVHTGQGYFFGKPQGTFGLRN